jgi:hypothetical protein
MTYDEDTIERQMLQFELDSFPRQEYNVLDNPVDDLIMSIKSKIKKNQAKYNGLAKKAKAKELKYKKLNKRRPYDNEEQIEMYNLTELNMFLEEELNALFEIKIIYAFKNLEINVKQLVSLAYPNEKIAKLYKWENLIEFFSLKETESSKLEEYKGVNQLRMVNNAIKHSNNGFDQSINSIEEFKGKKYFYYEDVEKFYLRVNKFPLKFLSLLKNKIKKDLFQFSSDRIKAIAKSFRQRMTKEQAMVLSEELLKYESYS